MIKWFLGAMAGFCLLIPGHTYAGGFGRIIYDPNYQVPQQQTIIAVPTTNFGLDYYYKVNRQNFISAGGTTALTDQDIDNIADRVATKVLEKLVSAAQGNGQQPANPGTSPQPQPQPQPQEPPLAAKVEAILQKNCVSCHGAKDAKANVALVDENNKLVKLDSATKWDIFDQVDTQAMPKNGNPLSVDEIETIREWARVK